MLNPNYDRLDYGKILAPPAGSVLDFAVGTTYSLDLDALVGASLALGLSEDTDKASNMQLSVCDATWPTWNEEYLVENTIKLGVAFNGKTRFEMQFAADADNQTIQEAVLTDERAMKYWALQYGECVEILSPNSLRESIAKIVLGMVGTYGVDAEGKGNE